MTGQEFKSVLLKTGKSLTEISKLFGLTTQGLNSLFRVADVKTGTVEKASRLLGIPLSAFYEHADGGDTNIGIANAVRGDVTINEAQQALTEQLQIKDKQIERLLDIIANKQ